MIPRGSEKSRILLNQGYKEEEGLPLKRNLKRRAWVAQSVRHPTLGFSSGGDLRVMRSSHERGSALNEEPKTLCLQPPPPPTLSLK